MKTVGMWVLVGALVLSFVGIGQAQPQEDPPAPRRPRQRDPEQMRQWREQMRQRMQDNMREQLGASKEEWQALWPLIEKVQTLQWQGRGFRFMGMLAGMRRRGRFGRDRQGGQQPRPAPAAQPQREQSETQKKADALRKLVEDKQTNPGSLKTALADLRNAREKARQALVKAQKDLQAVVSVRQEAQLVLMGVLE